MNTIDENIIKNIKKKDISYWDFVRIEQKSPIHSAHSYPAKMVPDMQADIIDTILQNDNSIKNIFDPYMGSGTVLIEGALRNLNLIGIDINPLAYLMTSVRLSTISIPLLKEKVENLFFLIDNSDDVEPYNFNGINKWFKEDVILQLSKIRYCITLEENILYRRIFWLAFAEIIRLSNNSQKSTFKLHIKHQDVIDSFEYDCIKNFKKQLNKDITSFEVFYSSFSSEITSNLYLGDSIEVMKDENKFESNSIDLIVTSPPYGDNHTTVTYGQFSVLPLRWIPLEDISENIDSSIIKTLTEIDKESLGGRYYTIEKIYESNILEKSDTLKNTFNNLLKDSENLKARKVASFYIDFYKCCIEISRILKKNKYAVFTIGNRRVNGKLVRFDYILAELFSTLGLEKIYSFDRNIPTKRIPSKISRLKNNKPVYSIQSETTLIFKKN